MTWDLKCENITSKPVYYNRQDYIPMEQNDIF